MNYDDIMANIEIADTNVLHEPYSTSMLRFYFERLAGKDEISQYYDLSFLMTNIHSKISELHCINDDTIPLSEVIKRLDELEELLYILNKRRDQLKKQLLKDPDFHPIEKYSNEYKKDAPIDMLYVSPELKEKYKEMFNENVDSPLAPVSKIIEPIKWLKSQKEIVHLMERLKDLGYIYYTNRDETISSHFLDKKGKQFTSEKLRSSKQQGMKIDQELSIENILENLKE